MSIVETGAKAMRRVVCAGDDWDAIGDTARDLYRNEFRAALRAIKPSDITEQMMRVFVVTLSCGEAPKPTEEDLELFRRALAAAIAAGAEQ